MIKYTIIIILLLPILVMGPIIPRAQTQQNITEQQQQEQEAKLQLQLEVRKSILQELQYQQLLRQQLAESESVLQQIFENENLTNTTRTSLSSIEVGNLTK